MKAGDIVYLNVDGLTTTWVTTTSAEVNKPDLPQSLYVGDIGLPLLHLVSCAGYLGPDGNYADNIIVTLMSWLMDGEIKRTRQRAAQQDRVETVILTSDHSPHRHLR